MRERTSTTGTVARGAGFPATRMRRLRRTDALRAMVRETALQPTHLIFPLFVREGAGVRQEVGAMPGVFQLSVDQVLGEAERALSLGIPAVLLFGIPDEKDETGAGAWAERGVVQGAARALKAHFPELVVITDVCLCEYTSHGHCGILRGADVANDESLELLARTALAQAEAGADIVAPSNMMDGAVGSIRGVLDERGYGHVPIMTYAAKYASGYYGPFREAAESAPSFGDRRSYQMDPANAREALREVALDVGEGADLLIVKPALAYLDILRQTRDAFDLPIAAYNVSGEYAMVKAAAEKGWIDERHIVLETLTGMRRAGADMIITYHALDAARWLREG